MAATSLSNVAHPVPTVRFAPLYSKPLPTKTNILCPPSLSSSLLLSAPKPRPIVAKPAPPRCSNHPTWVTISMGEKIPQVVLTHYDRLVLRTIRVSEVTEGKRVFIFVFAVDVLTDAAFKRFMEWAEEAKGSYDAIVALAVNGAWAPQRSLDAGDTVVMVGDEKGEFLKGMGFPPDLKDKAGAPFDLVILVLDGFVNYLRYGRGIKNFVKWERSRRNS